MAGKSGWDVPTRGKSAYPPKKSLRIQQIVKFGTEEVDEDKIYIMNR